MPPPVRRTRSPPRRSVARRDRALRRLRRMTAASRPWRCSRSAASARSQRRPSPGTSSRPPQLARPRRPRPPARTPSHAPAATTTPHPKSDRRGHGADDDAAAGHDADPAAAAAPRAPAAGPAASPPPPRPPSPPAARERDLVDDYVPGPRHHRGRGGRGAAPREAVRLLRAELDAIDRACSRFRADSELCAPTTPAGRLRRQPAVRGRGAASRCGPPNRPAAPSTRPSSRRSSPSATTATSRRCAPKRRTPSAACPAAGLADRDARRAAPPAAARARAAASTSARRPRPWPPTAPRPPSRRRRARPTLVNLGGDVATAGPVPAGGWPSTSPTTTAPAPTPTASSVTVLRRRAGDVEHDGAPVAPRRADRPSHRRPATGEPAAPVWRTVSVAAASCVDANTASTAAIVRGASAPQWLESLGLPARLVDPEGAVVTVGAWPGRGMILAAAGPSPLWYLSRGTGAITLVLLTATVVLGITRDAALAPGAALPRFVVDGLHRNVSLLVVVLLAAHVLTAVLDPFAHLRVLDAVVPLASRYRPLWLGLRRARLRPADRARRDQPAARAPRACAPGGRCTGSRTRAGRSRCCTASAPAPTRARPGCRR